MAFQLEKEIKGDGFTATAGGWGKINDQTTVQGKVDNNLEASFAIKRELIADRVDLTLSTALALKEAASPQNAFLGFGFKFDLNV